MGKSNQKSSTAKFLWLILGLVGFVVTPFLIFGPQLEALFSGDGALSLLADYGQYAWVIAICLLIADLVFPIPTSAIMAALGMLYGPIWGGVLAVLGSISSGLVGYVLCRYFGRPAAFWIGGAQGIRKGEQIFSGNMGGWLIVLSRWLPVFSEVLACLAGLSGMRFPIFLVALICGSAPLGFVYAGIGHLGVERPVLTLLASALLPLVLWFLARPWLKSVRKNSARVENG